MKALLKPLVVTVYCIAMLYAVVMGAKQPWYNWDMLGYVGSVVAWTEKTPEAIYEKTFTPVRAEVPDWVYKQYMENPLSAEARAFAQQLPLYNVKPLYTGLMWLVHQFGPTLPTASWMISVASLALLSIVLFLWTPRYMNHSVWLICIIGLTYLFPWSMSMLAHLSTPDALCTLLTTAMVYSWVERKSLALFVLFAYLSQFTRPEALMLSSGLAIYFAFMTPEPQRMNKLFVCMFVAVLMATYFVVSKFGGNYGLERWFIYAFIDKTPYPAEATSHLTLEMYWNTLAPSIILFVQNPRTALMIAWSLLAGLLYYLKPVAGNKQNLFILLITWSCLCVRFMMFPGWGEDRYYFVYFIIIIYTGGEMMAPYISALLKTLRTTHQKIVDTDV